jgi:gliding motility-associated protein GldC
MSTSNIQIRIDLDANKVPEKIEWSASDSGNPNAMESKSIYLAMLDKDSLDTSTLFLWTKECQVAEMDRKIFYALSAMTDGYFKATKNTDLANEMRRFVQYFGEKTGIISPEKS